MKEGAGGDRPFFVYTRSSSVFYKLTMKVSTRANPGHDYASANSVSSQY